jgi:hypothetical protein
MPAGVKFKPKDCKVKAKAGDTVSVHYKVCEWGPLAGSGPGACATALAQPPRAGALHPPPGRCDTPSLLLQGMLTDGTVFDESYKRGEPITFKLGAGNVIKGEGQQQRVHTAAASCGSARGARPAAACTRARHALTSLMDRALAPRL